MSEYTPPTDEVRETYVRAYTRNHDTYQTGWTLEAREGELRATFNRWLYQVMAEAWDEGFAAGANADLGDWEHPPEEYTNPYRKDDTDGRD